MEQALIYETALCSVSTYSPEPDLGETGGKRYKHKPRLLSYETVPNSLDAWVQKEKERKGKETSKGRH